MSACALFVQENAPALECREKASLWHDCREFIWQGLHSYVGGTCISGNKGLGSVLSGWLRVAVSCQNTWYCCYGEQGTGCGWNGLERFFWNWSWKGAANINLVNRGTLCTTEIIEALIHVWRRGWIFRWCIILVWKTETLKLLNRIWTFYLPIQKYLGSELAQKFLMRRIMCRLQKAAIERWCVRPEMWVWEMDTSERDHWLSSDPAGTCYRKFHI